MRCLGEYEDMPFFMVQAGRDMFKMETTGRVSRRPPFKPSLPSSTRAGSSNSEGSDSTLTTLATITTAHDGDSAVVDSIEQGEPQTKRSIGSSSSAKRSSSGRQIRRPTSPTALSTGRASSVLTQTEDNTPASQKSLLPPPIMSRQSARGNVPLPLALTQPPLVPRALALTVFLSKDSFVHSCGTRTKQVPQDVKIDVFFNGEMTASTYVPARYRGEANNMIQLTQRFSGRRMNRMAERPWVIVPPGQNADGTLRTNKRNKAAYVGAQQRWERIGKGLKEEGEKFGRNKYGEPSVVGEYLASLAKFEMPVEVDEMQKGGGPKFGVIDVVITLGKGQKDEPEKGYLKEPTKLRLRGFNDDEVRKQEDKAVKKSETEPLTERNILLIPFKAPSTEFATPFAPSAAPSAIRRRQSIALVAPNPISRSRPRPKRIGSLPTISTENFSAMQVRSPPMSSSPVSGLDLSLVPAGAPMPKFTGRREIDLPSPLPSGSSSSIPSSALGRSRRTKIPHSRKVRAAMDTDICGTEAEHNLQKQGTASSPTLSQRAFSPDVSMATPSSSSTSKINRPQNRRGTATTLTDDGLTSVEDSGIDDGRASSYRMEPFQEVLAAIGERRRKFARSRQRTKSGTSTSAVPMSPPKIPEKRYKHSLSAPIEMPNPKRQRYPKGWAVSDKPTLAEEMANIEALSKEENSAAILDGATRATRLRQSSTGLSTPAATEKTQAQTDAAETPPRKIVKLKIKGPAVPLKTFPPTTPATANAEGAVHNMPTQAPQEQISPKPTQDPPSAKSTNKPKSSTKPHPRRRRRPAANTHLPPNPVPFWPTPALSQDSILSYAEEAAWKTGASGGDRGVYRQIKAERNGWFEESGVLMGVRFLVG